MADGATGTTPALYLASRSPRRAAYLELLGVAFETVDADADETARAGEAPVAYVERVARSKAEAARGRASLPLPLLAADTTVSLDGRLFGKPVDAAHALQMLRALSGRWHEVHTAVVVAGQTLASVVVTTRVEFAPLSDATIEAYWQTGEPRDKAGAYGIQGLGGALVARVDGSYSAVVGLPLRETRDLLDAAGVPHRLRPAG